MADSMYTVEAAVLIVLVCVLWPLYVVQLLALRFTPRRRWIPIKAVMLATGFVGTVTLTARMVDPSSVFGRIPVYANSGLAVQATAGAFIIAASWLVASARSLHAQIQQPMPRFVTPVLYGSAFAFQLIDTSLIIAQSQMLQRPDLYSEWEVNRLDIALDLVLDAQTALVFVCNTYLYIRLRQKIATFIGTLQQQEEAVERAKQRQLQQTAATPAATTAKAPPSTAAAAPAGLSPAVHIRIQVHPEPATGGGGSAATHGRTGSGGPSASASVPPSSSASADRVRDLSGALRKLTYMSFCVSLVCIGAIANSVPRLNNLFQQIVEKQDLYGPDPAWYVWVNPAVWMSSAVRQAHHTPFWPTVLRGVRDEHHATYAPAASRQEARPQRPQQQPTKKDAGAGAATAKVAPAATTAVSPKTHHRPPSLVALSPTHVDPSVSAVAAAAQPPSASVAAAGTDVVGGAPLLRSDSDRQQAWTSTAPPASATDTDDR